MKNLFKLGIFLLIFLNLLPASFVRDTVDIGHFFSSVHMCLNGKDIRHFSSEEIGIQEQVDADVALTAKQGLNVLEIVYRDWNDGKRTTVQMIQDNLRWCLCICRYKGQISEKTIPGSATGNILCFLTPRYSSLYSFLYF